MNKKYLSVLLILVTLILSIYMIVFRGIKNDDYTLVDSSKQISETSQADLVSMEKNMNELIDDINEAENEAENKNEERKSNVKKEEQINESVDKNSKIKIEYEKEKSNLDKDNNSKVNEEKVTEINSEKEMFVEDSFSDDSKPVFKMDKNLIVGDMSMQNKATIIKMTTKLSMQDYASIIDTINKCGELESVVKINNILESRLSNDDYKVLEDIFDQYINLEIIK